MLPVTYVDYLLLPFYLSLIYFVAFIHKAYIPKSIRKYYIPALTIKLFCSIGFVLIYTYLYGYGDTFGYFNDANLLAELFLKDPSKALTLWFSSSEQFMSELPNYFISWNNNNYTVVQLIFPLVLVGAKSYIPSTLLLSFITFLGSWKLFEYFSKLYPHLIRTVALVLLFIPSVLFWSSGILKDSICLMALSFLFLAMSRIFIEGNYKIKYFLSVVISSYIIFYIKSYILIAFFPTFILYIILEKNHKISNRYLRRLLLPGVLFIGGIIGYLMINSLANDFFGNGDGPAIENAIQAGVELQETIISQDGGSSYSIQMEPTIPGLIMAAPKAISTTLFRPYPWEANNVLMILTSIESSLLLFFTLYVIFKLGLRKSFKIIFSSPIIVFLFTFSIIFALFVGFSTGNFGTLIRYKIPCIPFYALALTLMIHKNYVEKAKIS